MKCIHMINITIFKNYEFTIKVCLTCDQKCHLKHHNTHTHTRMHAHAHTHTHTHTHTQDLIQNFKLLGNSNLAVAKVQMKEQHQRVCRPRQTRSSKNFLSGWINSPYLGQLQISYLAVLIYPGLFLTLVGFVKYSLTVQKDIH